MQVLLEVNSTFSLTNKMKIEPQRHCSFDVDFRFEVVITDLVGPTIQMKTKIIRKLSLKEKIQSTCV